MFVRNSAFLSSVSVLLFPVWFILLSFVFKVRSAKIHVMFKMHFHFFLLVFESLVLEVNADYLSSSCLLA